MTAPTTAGGAVLPVVAWQGEERAHCFISDVAKNANSAAVWPRYFTIPLTPRDAAQAEIDALRAEVERLNLLVLHGAEGRAEAEHAERYYRQAEALLTKNERTLHAEVAALKAAQDDQARDSALRMARAHIVWLAFGERRSPGWDGAPPSALEAVAAIDAATKETP